MIKSARNRNGVLCYFDDEVNQKVKSRKEFPEQVDLNAFCEDLYPWEYKLMFHVPNESKCAVQHRRDLNMAGIKKGASDWIILISRKGYGSMILELKRARKRDSTISKEQTDFLLTAEKEGNFAVVAYGFRAALAAIEYYLK